jgi:hypothetical protein
LDLDIDPEDLRVEIVHTLAECESRDPAAQYVPLCLALLEQWGLSYATHLSILDKIIRAESRVHAADDELDDFLYEVARILRIDHAPDSPLFRQYFGTKQPSELARPILGDELELVRSWLPDLEKSSDTRLQALAPKGKLLVAKADTAVADLAAARKEHDVFRLTGEYAKLVDQVNATRKSIYGALSQLPHQAEGKALGLPGDYADRFFLHEKRRNKRVTVETVEKEIKALLAKVDKLKAQLEELQKQDLLKKQASEDRAAMEAELSALEKESDEKDKRIKELKAKLKK